MKYILQTLVLVALLTGMNFLASCGSDEPQRKKALIEDTEGETGGFELVEREFEACQGSPIQDPNVPRFLRRSSDFDWSDSTYASHSFDSLGEMYPERGSYRQTKSEIMDIVDRQIYAPERGLVRLLHYFDMVLLLNVAPRDGSTPSDSSAQRMQILVKTPSSTNDIRTWSKIETWAISTGIPCLTASGIEKIATFTGVYKFNPGRIYEKYKSELWDVDMYQTAFLHHSYQNGATTGVAMHGTLETSSLGRRASGGCIRVHQPKMQCLYETMEGLRSTQCLSGGKLDYRGTVPSLLSEWGEADSEVIRRTGGIEMNGRRVLIAIFNDENDSVNDSL